MALAPLSQIDEQVKKLLQMPSEPSHHLQQVQEDLEALQRMLRRIQAVLNDAEKRGIQEQVVKLWLRELKGVAYDADDVLDEYKYELIRAKVEVGSIQAHHEAADHLPYKRKYQYQVSESAVSIPLDASFCGEIAGKIRKIRDRFEEISRDRVALHLKEGNAQGHSQVSSTNRPPSSHIADAPQIYGRKDELEKVINLLLYSDECKKSNLSVLPIVGMGGVGKTTLVQHVYNDQRISRHFQMRGWVCVSDDFTVEKLTARIIESLSMQKCHSVEFSVLQERLKELLDGKLFLLVLDDVWNESRTLWESLRKPLRFGAQGSAVVTTTRIEPVAKMMQTMPFHRLECLSVNDCWEVLRHSAFVDRDPNDIHPDFKEVGMKIVKKCGCLPLAAKSLGGLLSYETEVAAWEGVLQSDIWDLDDNSEEIIPALRLSYLHLSNHLKQCFLYASIFPKDSDFWKDDIIPIWMAQGLLECRSSKQGAEDFGNQCFKELLQRSFFHCLHDRHDTFVMHDLIHDLARQISGGEFFHMDGDEAPLPHLNEVRHVLVTRQDVVDLERMLHIPCSTIRTFIVTGFMVLVKFPSQMMPPLKFLRALKLNALSIDELPDSIGDLMHLRYLSLDFSNITRLPDSICKLYNLQTLCLGDCRRLERLPKDVQNLRNLQHLKIWGTQFAFLPSGFGQLTSLRRLDVFDVVHKSCPISCHDDEGCSKTKESLNDLSLQHANNEEISGGIEVLKELNHLTGRLHIFNLQLVMDAEDAKLADLRNKRNMKELLLCWRSCSGQNVGSHGAASSVVQTQVLENLQPPVNLQVLEIYHYGGLSFPSWMGSGDPTSPLSSLSRLVRLEIGSCKQCTSLPPLGQLPGLKYLKICYMDMVKAVGSEFYGGLANTMGFFPMLEELTFDSMGNWVTWDHAVAEGRVFPRLRRLSIESCPQLELMVPLYLLQALEEVHVRSCPELMIIELANCPSSIGGLQLPPLKKMEIMDCPRARFSPDDDGHLFQLPPTLGCLNIIDSPLLMEWCERGNSCRLAHIPDAKIWTTSKH